MVSRLMRQGRLRTALSWCVVFALSVSVAWIFGLQQTATQAAAPTETYVYVSCVTQVPFWIDQKQALADVGQALGVRAVFTGPTTADPQAEAAALDQIIASHPAGIMVFPCDEKALTPGINRAVDAGIPVITMIGDVPGSKRFTHIGINNFRAGVEGAKLLAAAIGGKGKVVVGTFQAAGVLDRMRGYKDYLAKNYPGIKVVAVVDDHADPSYAPQAYAAAIAANPDLAGIGGTDGDSGVGAARAVIEAGKKGKIKIIAMDRNEDMLNYIADGTITAAVAQKSYLETWLAVQLLYALRHNAGPGKMLPDWRSAGVNPLPVDIDTGIMPITTANVKQFRHKK
ncbi:MAG TPA: substrate-binding domain-containing protein [bacterium]